jgi:hypothetical protein
MLQSSHGGLGNDEKFYVACGAFVLGLGLFIGAYFLTAKMINRGAGGGGGPVPYEATPTALSTPNAKQPSGLDPSAPVSAEQPRPSDAQERVGEQQRLLAQAQQEQIDNEARQLKLRQENERKLQDARRNSLRSARRLVDKGQGDKAKGRLEALIRDYPGTPEADEAQRILTDLSRK